MDKLKDLFRLSKKKKVKMLRDFPMNEWDPNDSLNSDSDNELRDYEFHNVADEMIEEEDTSVADREARAMQRQLLENIQREIAEERTAGSETEQLLISDETVENLTHNNNQYLNKIAVRNGPSSLVPNGIHPLKRDSFKSSEGSRSKRESDLSKKDSDVSQDDAASVSGSVVSNMSSRGSLAPSYIPFMENFDAHYGGISALKSFSLSCSEDLKTHEDYPGMVQNVNEEENANILSMLEWLYTQSTDIPALQLDPMTDFTQRVVSGGLIQGQVHLELAEKLSVRFVELRAFGFAQIYRQGSKHKSTYKKLIKGPGELLLLQTFQLCKDVDMLLPGTYNFPFRFRLPKDLAPSLVTASGDKLLTATYFIEARILRTGPRPSTRDIVCVNHMPVTRPFDISAADFCMPAVWAFTERIKLNKPVNGSKKHQIHIEVRLPKMAFLKNEIVPVTALFDNKSPLPLNSFKGRIVMKIMGALKGKNRKLITKHVTSPAVSERTIDPGCLRMIRFEMEPVFLGSVTDGGDLVMPDSTHQYQNFMIVFCVEIEVIAANGQSVVIETPLLIGNYSSVGEIRRSPRIPAKLNRTTRTEVGKLS